MKYFKAKMIALLMVAFASLAYADSYDLAYKSSTEFPTTTTAPASGDKKLIWVAADNKWEQFAATSEKLTGTFNGIVGGTTPAAGTFTTLNASGAVTLTGALGTTSTVTYTRAPAADSATTNNTSKVLLTAPVDTTGTNTHNAYDIALTISNATGGTNTVNGLKVENVTGDAQVDVKAINIGTGTTLGTSNAIQIGSGWDAGIVTDSGVQINSTNGTLVTAFRVASDTVASGQTAKTVTVTGVTASSKCVAQANEVPTNAAYIKSAAPGTDQVVVTVNTDPGASNLDLTVMCVN